MKTNHIEDIRNFRQGLEGTHLSENQKARPTGELVIVV